MAKLIQDLEHVIISSRNLNILEETSKEIEENQENQLILLE